MVSLIGHANDARTPASTAWLVSGAVALNLLALILTERHPRRRRASRGRLPTARLCTRRGSGCCASRRLGPPDTVAPRVIARGNPVVLWFFAVNRFLAADAWAAEGSADDY